MTVEENPYDDEKLEEIRKGQEDPIVQYFIVNIDLGMSAGKIAAQCAHAAQMMVLKHLENKKSIGIPYGGIIGRKINNTDKWLKESFRKVILRAHIEDFDKIKEEYDCFVVKDAGLTEVEKGSETVICLWPVKKSLCGDLIKGLQAL